jgi:RNA 2',3'-cyclic 3'-phosphodiesterase
MENCRLFIGTAPAGEALEALQAFDARRQDEPLPWTEAASWTKPPNWHLTWLFLGSVPARDIPQIQSRLAILCQSLSPVALKMTGTEFWPNARRPRMLVWRGEAAKALELARSLRKAFPEFPDEKPFRPHITLARFKASPGKPDKPSLQAARWVLSSLTLYQSRPEPGGSVYEGLWSGEFSG